MVFSIGVDPLSGDSASVSAVQAANNVSDQNVGGGFTVHLHGLLHSNSGNIPGQDISCSSAAIPPGTAIRVENEYEPFDPAHPYYYADD